MKEFIDELKHNQKINIEKGLENRVDIDYVIERLEDIKMQKEEKMILEPFYSSRKSFYGKARVNIYENEKVIHKELISYDTLVANYVFYKEEKKEVFEWFGYYSCTTTSHQKEFFKQLGLNDKKIQELKKDGRLEINYD